MRDVIVLLGGLLVQYIVSEVKVRNYVFLVLRGYIQRCQSIVANFVVFWDLGRGLEREGTLEVLHSVQHGVGFKV